MVSCFVLLTDNHLIKGNKYYSHGWRIWTLNLRIFSLSLTLKGIPPEARKYRLGTYSALDWILERYKEKTPKDPTIREKFNTYKFADYTESGNRLRILFGNRVK